MNKQHSFDYTNIKIDVWLNLKPPAIQPPPRTVSTSKLTAAIVASTCSGGGLVAWTPVRPGPYREARTVFLHHEVAARFNANPWPRDRLELDDDPSTRRRQFHAILERFVTGSPMMIKHEVKLLQPSSPEFVDLWEFRSMPPDPQTRLLGYLGAKGCFIGLWFGMRRDLGEMGDVRWSNAAKKCEERFLELFPTSTPLKAAWPIAGRQGLSGYFDE